MTNPFGSLLLGSSPSSVLTAPAETFPTTAIVLNQLILLLHHVVSEPKSLSLLASWILAGAASVPGFDSRTHFGIRYREYQQSVLVLVLQRHRDQRERVVNGFDRGLRSLLISASSRCRQGAMCSRNCFCCSSVSALSVRQFQALPIHFH